MLTAARDGGLAAADAPQTAVLEPEVSDVSWSVVDIVVESRQELRRLEVRRQAYRRCFDHVRVTNVVDGLLI